jgi:hypothetical protein
MVDCVAVNSITINGSALNISVASLAGQNTSELNGTMTVTNGGNRRRQRHF